LTKRFGFPESKAKWLALRSQGKPGKALKMANEKSKQPDDETSWVLPILTQRDKGRLLLAFKRAEDISQIEGSLDIILSWYRDLLLIKHNCQENLLMHGDEKKQLEQIAQSYSVVELENLITMTLNMQNLMKRNVNPILAMEVMMFNTFKTLSTRL
jgi:DNA polymerase-3 subunit delta'